MKIKGAIVFGVVLLSAMNAFAQDFTKVEIPMVYSFMRFNPENSHIVGVFSLNGGAGGIAVYIYHLVGIEAEFNGDASLPKIFSFPSGAIRICSKCLTVSAD